MNAPTAAMIKYFNDVVDFPVKESVIANKVIDAFEIKSVFDLWKIGAYVEYVKDERLDISQIIQDLGTTMYYGIGDCEDIARAQIVLGKNIKVPAYYLMMFPDNSYKNGHVMELYIENNNLIALNYTTYYTAKDETITSKDVENNTQAFQNALAAINYHIIRDLKQYQILWIIKTDQNEKPIGYINGTNRIQYGDVEVKEFPNTRDAVMQYMKKINLDELIKKKPEISTTILFAIIGILGTLIIWRWFT